MRCSWLVSRGSKVGCANTYICIHARSILCLGDSSVAARRSYIRQERRAPVATAVFHSVLKPCAPRILLIRYIRKLIVIRWSRVYTRKSPVHRALRALPSSSTRTNEYRRTFLVSLFIHRTMKSKLPRFTAKVDVICTTRRLGQKPYKQEFLRIVFQKPS